MFQNLKKIGIIDNIDNKVRMEEIFMGTTNYIAIVKQLENGRFLISFPDFEGLSTTAETEENIQYIATEIIKVKLAELKKSNLEISVPKKITEVSKNLQAGEFTTYVFITEDTASKNIKNNKVVKETFKDVKVVKKDENIKKDLKAEKDNKSSNETFTNHLNKFDNFIVNDLRKSVPEGKEHLLSVSGSVLSIITSLVFPFYTITGIWSFGILGLHFFHLNIFYVILVVAFLILAALTIYASLSKNMLILQISTFINIGLFAICYILVFITALRDPFISMGTFKMVLYFISVILIYLGYSGLRALKNSDE